MTERLHFHFSLSCIGEGNGNPLQCSCLEDPRDGGAWWADVYGVAQKDTAEATQQQQALFVKKQTNKQTIMKHFRVMEYHSLNLLSNGSGENTLLYYCCTLYVSLRFFSC